MLRFTEFSLRINLAYHARMSILGGNELLLVRAREYRSTTDFPEIHLYRPFKGLQSQKCFFALFFDIE